MLILFILQSASSRLVQNRYWGNPSALVTHKKIVLTFYVGHFRNGPLHFRGALVSIGLFLTLARRLLLVVDAYCLNGRL